MSETVVITLQIPHLNGMTKEEWIEEFWKTEKEKGNSERGKVVDVQILDDPLPLSAQEGLLSDFVHPAVRREILKHKLDDDGYDSRGLDENGYDRDGKRQDYSAEN